MTEPATKVKRTRKRIPQSCEPCRRRKLKCDRQHPACQNCVKRGIEGACSYAEAPEDEKTRALRTRLEQLEEQVREITSSLSREENRESPENEEDPDIQLLQQFGKLRIRAKDNALYYGPNSRFAVVQEYPEIFKARKHLRKDCKENFQRIREALRDETIFTGFPFAGISSGLDLQAMLPVRNLSDQLVKRYFECYNSLFTIVDKDDYLEQYSQVWLITPPPPHSLLAVTFFIIAIGCRSLNDGSQLLSQISSEGIQGALKAANRWKKYGQIALSQTELFKRTGLTNIQALLLLSLLEDSDHVRWNMLGFLGNMARIAGLHRDPNVFQELEEKERSFRRRLWLHIYILDQIEMLIAEALRYGHPPNLAEGSYDCEPAKPVSPDHPNADESFLYWMFKLQNTIATSYPGPLGLQKNLASVERNDQRIRDLLEELPPELHLSENYTPIFDESPLQVIRRYTIGCMIQGHLLTLHRPYASKSPLSKNVIGTAAWTLTTYQNQVIALADLLEPYQWFIEEFLDAEFFRAIIYLGGSLLRQPDDPQAHVILRQIQLCSVQAKSKMLRKRDYGKASGMLDALERTLTGEQSVEGRGTTELSAEGGVGAKDSPLSGSDGNGWDMGEILTESAFRWDDYLVDMVLDSREQEGA